MRQAKGCGHHYTSPTHYPVMHVLDDGADEGSYYCQSNQSKLILIFISGLAALGLI